MRGMRMVIFGGVALGIAGGGLAEAHSLAASKTVVAKSGGSGFVWAAAKLTVAKGTRVVWKNVSQAPHTVTSVGKNWHYNKQLAQGKTVSHVFKQAGVYHYYCAIHPFMKGTIVVR